MGLNNINTEAAGKFFEAVKNDPQLAKKSKQVKGEWRFEDARPQFKATLSYKEGDRVVESDFPPFMGGNGLAPDPISYCLYGMAACYAGTFMSLAAMEGVEIKSLNITVGNNVDLTMSMGLSSNPIVEGVEMTLTVESDAPGEKLIEIDELTKERCPGVYCLTHPIKLTGNLVVKNG